MSGAKNKLTPDGVEQHGRLNEVSKRYLKTERKHLAIFVLVGWVFFGAGSLYFMFGYLGDLGSPAPSASIHEQTAAEQASKIINSKLGKTGGMPLQTQKHKGSDKKEQAKEKKTPLDYLSDARDLDAQEGVWKASRVIAIVALVQTFIGLGGLILVYGTLKATQDTFREARKATRFAALATKAAVKTAEAAERTERAYLFVDFECEFARGQSLGTNTLIADGGSEEGKTIQKGAFIIRPVVRNYGKTPAVNVSLQSHCDKRGEIDWRQRNQSETVETIKNIVIPADGSRYVGEILGNTYWYVGQVDGRLPEPAFLRAWVFVDYGDINGEEYSSITEANIRPSGRNGAGVDGSVLSGNAPTNWSKETIDRVLDRFTVNIEIKTSTDSKKQR